MRLINSLSLAAALLPSSLARAAPDQATPLRSEISLSEAEKEQILEAAAASSREQPLRQENKATTDEKIARPIHGEVGFEIGTGGYRSAYGTAVVPLEDNGVAIISLDSTDLGSRTRHFDPWWR